MQMYCTGGIRCDIYSTFLKQKGFTNLYTLEGGIQNYLDSEGASRWNGSLYVFDDRMAVGPGHMDGAAAAEVPMPAAQPCALCGGEPELPHVNCANVDCNLLFLCCAECRKRLKGCCCESCRDTAPRLLRPLRAGMLSSACRVCGVSAHLPRVSSADQRFDLLLFCYCDVGQVSVVFGTGGVAEQRGSCGVCTALRLLRAPAAAAVA